MAVLEIDTAPVNALIMTFNFLKVDEEEKTRNTAKVKILAIRLITLLGLGRPKKKMSEVGNTGASLAWRGSSYVQFQICWVTLKDVSCPGTEDLRGRPVLGVIQ